MLALLLKYQALLHIPVQYKHQTLLFFPLVARFSQVRMTVGAKNARREGLGSAFIGTAGICQFVFAGVVTLAGAWLLLGLRGIYCCLTIYLFTWGLKWWFNRKLGGITGDIIGCTSELNEILTLLVLLALLG
jgi:adenosylcobinamide-GDP ribazoletransferase